MRNLLVSCLPLVFGVLHFFHLGDVMSCCGKCTGSAYCTACTTCEYCQYCNSGGSCGVCNPFKRNKASQPYKSKTYERPSYTSPKKSTSTYSASKIQKAISYNNRYDFNSRLIIEQFLQSNNLLPSYEVDGIIDSDTIKAIMELQRKLGLVDDGCFGPKTLERVKG